MTGVIISDNPSSSSTGSGSFCLDLKNFLGLGLAGPDGPLAFPFEPAPELPPTPPTLLPGLRTEVKEAVPHFPTTPVDLDAPTPKKRNCHAWSEVAKQAVNFDGRKNKISTKNKKTSTLE